jgi:hypothetical protein
MRTSGPSTVHLQGHFLPSLDLAWSLPPELGPSERPVVMRSNPSPRQLLFAVDDNSSARLLVAPQPERRTLPLQRESMLSALLGEHAFELPWLTSRPRGDRIATFSLDVCHYKCSPVRLSTLVFDGCADHVGVYQKMAAHFNQACRLASGMFVLQFMLRTPRSQRAHPPFWSSGKSRPSECASKCFRRRWKQSLAAEPMAKLDAPGISSASTVTAEECSSFAIILEVLQGDECAYRDVPQVLLAHFAGSWGIIPSYQHDAHAGCMGTCALR